MGIMGVAFSHNSHSANGFHYLYLRSTQASAPRLLCYSERASGGISIGNSKRSLVAFGSLGMTYCGGLVFVGFHYLYLRFACYRYAPLGLDRLRLGPIKKIVKTTTVISTTKERSD